MLKRQKNQNGQTLIETIAAAFILVMGISAAVGLAIYALSTSTAVSKQIIAIGLAREGIESVKNMRDTNWLKLTMDTDCYNLQTMSSTPPANCYKDWLGNVPTWIGVGNIQNDRGFYIDPGSATTTATLDVYTDSADKYWNFSVISGNAFGLDQNNNIGVTGFTEIYIPKGSAGQGSSGYYRKITLANDKTAPYFSQSDIGPRLLATVEVWWVDKQCPATDTPPSSGRCYVKLQTSLTNWKNYQP